jgi:L-amino acid N-acyltransferase YncA
MPKSDRTLSGSTGDHGAASLSGKFIVREAGPSDLEHVQRIYAHHVLTGLASFEVEPPDLGEIGRRYEAVVAKGLPYLIAVQPGRGSESAVLGFAYAAPYRARPAYRFTLEDSIYVDEGVRGRGVGRSLLAELLARCSRLGYRQMLAVIGDSANAGSIGLHAALGFREAGRLNAVGFKFGRWVDSVIMQVALGEGERTLPERGE